MTEFTLKDLTKNGVRDLYNNGTSGDGLKDPVFQCLTVKPVAPAPNKDGEEKKEQRYRAILSDGTHYVQGMIAGQMRSFAEDGTLTKDTVFRLTSYSISKAVQGKSIVILLDFEILGQAEGRLGAPTPYEQSAAGGGSIKNESNEGGGSVSPKKREAPTNSTKANPPKRNSNSSNSTADTPIYPIEGLSPYQNRWTIKARVTSKSDVKHWKNARGEGKLFSVNLMDESGEIKATGFNDTVDSFYNLLTENKVYRISKGKITIAKKQFSNLNNEYELTLESHTVIEECEDASEVPEVKYDFVDLDHLLEINPNGSCDVMGVLHSVSDLSTITSKATQKEVTKREITLVDTTEYSVRCTLWGKTAENFSQSEDDHPAIILKGVKVGDFGGRSLSVTGNTTLTIDPDLPKAHGLRGWYTHNASTANWKSYSSASAGGVGANGPIANQEAERKTIQEAKDENLGMRNDDDKPDYFNMRGFVTYIKPTGLWYPACTSDDCNKKVLDVTDGFECMKCNKIMSKPQYRYVLSANVADFSGSTWVSGFNDIGEKLIGMTADDLQAIQADKGGDEGDDAVAKATTKVTHKQWLFACRAKQDTYQDQTRVRYTILKAEPVDYVKVGNELARKIQEMMNNPDK